MSAEISKTISHYRILEKIGSGGMAIFHRDIKPANIMITPDSVANILDFGLAKDSNEQYQNVGDMVKDLVAKSSPDAAFAQTDAGNLTLIVN